METSDTSPSLIPGSSHMLGQGRGRSRGQDLGLLPKRPVRWSLVYIMHSTLLTVYNSTFTSDLAGNVPAFRYHTYQLESITVASPILYPWASYNIR